MVKREIGHFGESKVGWIRLNRIHQAEYIHADDMDAWEELLVFKKPIDPR